MEIKNPLISANNAFIGLCEIRINSHININIINIISVQSKLCILSNSNISLIQKLIHNKYLL